MGDKLFEKLYENWPYAAILFACVIATGSIVFMCSKKYFHWTGKIIKSELDCAKIDSEIAPKLTSIQKDIKSLLMYLKSKDPGGFDTALFETHSPVQLTILGRELLGKSGGRGYIDAHAKNLISDIDAMHLKAALDVENFCFDIITRHSDDDDFIPIKDFVYNNPTYKAANSNVQIDLSKIIQLMGIYLRDKYLDKNPHLVGKLP